jgi:hypothetical protein
MRTTVLLDDRLFRAAKRRAASRGVSFSQLVSEALRVALQETTSATRDYAMVTYGGKASVHHEPVEFADTDDDESRLGK